jgi:plastocyanin
MKIIFLCALTLLTGIMQIKATSYNITTAGFTYSPGQLTIQIGDLVNISASTIHPLVQVDKTTWENNGNTPKADGWGTKTSTYQFTGTTEDTIYFVCGVHYAMGMKGKIIIQNAFGIAENKNTTANIDLYPNPIGNSARINIKVDFSHGFIAEVQNYYGQNILNMPFEQTNDGEFSSMMDASSLGNGIYFLVISNDKKTYLKKFIVAK